MIAIRQILCPIDFSEPSRLALDHAVALARWYRADIRALHVMARTPSTGKEWPYVHPISEEPATHQQLSAELRRFAEPAQAAGIATKLALREGVATAEILKEARACAADLIVMGTHGRRGFERWAMGSVAEEVLRKAPCPVMTGSVRRPPRLPPVPFQRILCAVDVDLSKPSRRALEYALSLAQEAKAHLTLLHVLEWFPQEVPRPDTCFNVVEYSRFLEREARERLQSAVPLEARQSCQPEEIVTTGKAYEEILRVAEEQKIDLVVMGVHERSALDLIFFGSTTNRVVRDALCPVLTIRMTAQEEEGRLLAAAGN